MQWALWWSQKRVQPFMLKENFVMVSRWIIICMSRKFNRLLFCWCNKWLCNKLFVSLCRHVVLRQQQSVLHWELSTIVQAWKVASWPLDGLVIGIADNYLLERTEKHADTVNSDSEGHHKLSHTIFLEGISIETKWTSLLIGSH